MFSLFCFFRGIALMEEKQNKTHIQCSFIRIFEIKLGITYKRKREEEKTKKVSKVSKKRNEINEQKR